MTARRAEGRAMSANGHNGSIGPTAIWSTALSAADAVVLATP